MTAPVRLADLTPAQRRIVLALVDAARIAALACPSEVARRKAERAA